MAVAGGTTTDRPSGRPPGQSRLEDWLRRRLILVLASLGLLGSTMFWSMWWCPHVRHTPGWATPGDLWHTMVAAQALNHLDLAGVYTTHTELVTLPGGALILSPVAAVVSAAGWVLGPPVTAVTYTLAWVVAGPYEVLLSCSALFAFDALARALGVGARRRAALVAGEAVALWNVSARWGHPEDAVAVALVVWAMLALRSGAEPRAAWLLGAAVAVQPLVILAVPVLATTVAPRRWPALAARVAVLPVALTVGPLAANPSGTIRAIWRQPNHVLIDRPTPWVHFAPRLSAATVAAGPGRLVGLAVCLALAVPAAQAVRARSGPRGGGPWPDAALAELTWWVALALSVRCGFEAVMVAYYLWPGAALLLVAAAGRRPARFGAAWALVVALTFFSNVTWHGEWGWWSVVVVALAGGLVLARPPVARVRVVAAAL